MIKIKDLNKSFNDLKVLENINLTINDGEIFGLIGRSGTGKSTLLRCLNGLEKYESGSILVDNVAIEELDDEELLHFRKNIGMIFQNFSLLNRITVFENVALPLQCWNYSKKQIKEKVHSLLEVVGLKEKINSKPSELSGGQKQRVAIARALTLEPKILLCDEATSALDPNTANSFMDLIIKINQQTSITTIIVSHQMSVIKKMCDRTAILANKTIQEIDSTRNIFIKKPLSLVNLMGGEIHALPANKTTFEVFIDRSLHSYYIEKIIESIGLEFSIIPGEQINLKDGNISSLIITTKNDLANSLKLTLDSFNLEWKIIDELLIN